MEKNKKMSRLDELDGLRGLLSSWVAISHILLWCGLASLNLPKPFGSLWRGFVFSMPAVETFIILSGFAISFLLHARSQSYWTFMRGRFFRIYPVYLVCLIFGMCLIGITPMTHPLWQGSTAEMMRGIFESERNHFFTHALSHLSLLNGLIPRKLLPDATGTLLPPGWSISLEWQYYLVAPIIARWVQSSSRLLALGGIAYIGGQIAYRWQNPHLAFLPAQLPLFMVGIGSYHFYAKICSGKDGRSPRHAITFVAFACAAMLLCRNSVALVIWALAFGSTFLEGTGFVARLLGVVRRILLHHWLQQLGRISYPLYLVHWPVILICFYLLGQWSPGIAQNETTAWMLIFAPPLIFAASVGLHKWVEAPLMKLGKGNPQRG